MRKMIPNGDSETTARKLGEILQASGTIHDAEEFLLQAHRLADQLLNRGSPWSVVCCVQSETSGIRLEKTFKEEHSQMLKAISIAKS